MQTSMVFNQREWPGAGDVDDCWVVADIQCMNVTAPGLRLVSVPKYRLAAGNIDRPGPTGGSIEDTMRGMTTLHPVYRGELKKIKGWTWGDFTDLAREHRPLSLSVLSGKLPTRMQFGFTGSKSFHRISLVVKGGRWLVANPLAPVYSRWQTVNPDELKPAVLAYGRAAGGYSGAWAVAFPTEERMTQLLVGALEDDTPFDQEDIDAATALLEARIAAAQAALGGAPNER